MAARGRVGACFMTEILLCHLTLMPAGFLLGADFWANLAHCYHMPQCLMGLTTKAVMGDWCGSSSCFSGHIGPWLTCLGLAESQGLGIDTVQSVLLAQQAVVGLWMSWFFGLLSLVPPSNSLLYIAIQSFHRHCYLE